MLCADTSFLFALYCRDVHTAKAVAQMEQSGSPLLLSPFNEFELANALRLAEFRRLLPAGEAAHRIEAVEEDQAAGRWRLTEVPLSEILAEAGRLSAAHTPGGGHRAYDILHVAHARLARARQFLTFDAKQRALAKAAGLRV